MKFLIVLLFLCAAYARQNYSSYSVVKLWPINEEQVKIVGSLDNDYDIWAEYNHIQGWSQVLVPPHKQKEFTELMNKEKISYETSISDVQRLIDANKGAEHEKGTKNTDLPLNQYNTLGAINAWLDALQDSYPDNVAIVIGGQSFEERQIKGVKLSFGRANSSAVIEGGIHSREWIATATVVYLINEFLTSTDPQVRDLAEAFDWHLFPTINPDGYEYSHTTDRLWRKNRSTRYLCDGQTAGVDLNRNFDFNWMVIGSSTNPCTDTHAGAMPFSEPEARTWARYLASVPNLQLFLTMHSYSQLILVPYGHTTEVLDNYVDVYEVGVRAADAIAKRYNTIYQVGTSSVLLSPVSGNSRDWVKSTLRVPIAWLYELRDTGTYGFLLPANQIIPNCLEVMDSLISVLDTGRTLKYFHSSAYGLSMSSLLLLLSILLNYLVVENPFSDIL